MNANRKDWMRITGCICVAVGFLWLVAIQCAIRPLQSAVLIKHVRDINSEKQFTGEELGTAVSSSTRELVKRIPPILLPAAIMLIGAVLLDASARGIKLHIRW